MPQYQQVPSQTTVADADLLLFWNAALAVNRNIRFDDFFEQMVTKVNDGLSYQQAYDTYLAAIAATEGAEGFAEDAEESAADAEASAEAAAEIAGINLNQQVGTVLAGPISGSPSTPTFRALEISDTPLLALRAGRQAQYGLGSILAKMKRGDAVNIACYGDSTTQGSHTTGWSPNPTYPNGDAVGLTDQATRAPFAWPTVMEPMIRDYYKNNNIRTWNAGYGGKAVDDGWALRNYQQAVINNPAYGNGTPPHLTFLQFGLNDVQRTESTSYLYVAEYRKLIERIINDGTLPVLLASDAIWERDPASVGSERRVNTTVSREYTVTLSSLAEEYKIPYFEIDKLQKDWIHFNGNGYNWGSVQPDSVHFGDIGHNYKAQFLTRMLVRDILIHDTNKSILTWTDSRMDYPLSATASATNSALRFSPYPFFLAESFSSNQIVAEFWVWVEGKVSPPNLIYRNGIHSMQRGYSEEEASKININGVDVTDPTAGPNPQITGLDRPWVVGKLNNGLNKIQLIAPEITSNNWNAGWFEVNSIGPSYRDYNSTWKRGPNKSMSVNLIRDCGPFKIQAVAPGVGRNDVVFVQPEAIDLSNTISLSKTGDSVDIFWMGKISKYGGIMIFSGRSGSSAFSGNASGAYLQRRGGSLLPDSIALGIHGSGSSPGWVTISTGDTAKIWLDDGSDKLLIRVSRLGTSVASIKVFDGWSDSEAILLDFTQTATSTATDDCIGLSGVMAGLMANSDSENVPIATAETNELFAKFTSA